jgi:hypothetical protein
MKGIISIFTMPQELEDLASTLEKLKRNSVYLDGSVDFRVEVTMCLSNELTDWENSKLPKEYIKQRSIELCEKYLDWCEWEILHDTNKILGCVSQRRYSLKNNPDADFFIWLDCDMFFNDITLSYMSNGYKMIKESGFEDIIITPEFVKQWDNTWDMVANKNYWNQPLNYHLNANIYKDSIPTFDEIQIKELVGYKFAGGWFTLISKSILDKTDIPESFGHYGLEDTFVMICCGIMKNNGINVSQFILENLIVGEIHKNRTNRTIKSYLSTKDRKEEFKKIAEANFNNELIQFNNKFIQNDSQPS